MQIKEIAKIVEGVIQGNDLLDIQGVTSADFPKEGFISFINDPAKIKEAESSLIPCFLAPPETTSDKKTLIIVKNPKKAWAELLTIFCPPRKYKPGISEKAFVSAGVSVDPSATIEPFVFIGERVKIGKGTVVRANAYIDSDVTIAENTLIHPNVMIYDHCVIGSRVIIHAGSVIGADGFGYVFTGREHYKVPQIGNVIIEDEVEIGANVCVDRATMGSTLIQKGVKLDNLVQVAHNVQIGQHSVASSQVGISGSSKVGSYCILAGQVGISDHCEIGDGTIIGAQAGLPTKKKIPPQKIYFGSPARPYEETRKILGSQPFLADTIKKVRELEKRLAEIEKKEAITGKVE